MGVPREESEHESVCVYVGEMQRKGRMYAHGHEGVGASKEHVRERQVCVLV